MKHALKSVSSIRFSKKTAIEAAVKMVPQYAELLRDLQKGGGRFQFQERIANYRNSIGAYVRLYEDEQKLNVSFAIGLLGENVLKDFSAKADSSSGEELQAILDEFLSDESLLESLDNFEFPQTEKEWATLQARFESLTADEQEQNAKQGALFYGGAFAGFFNTLSLMVHGIKLTALVPQALSGDDEAFLKAVQIDRLILTHFPYFQERKQRAQDTGDDQFLAKLAYRERNPPLRGKIQYPGLYMLFGCLETAQWLNDLTHAEILDLCDQAKLDRYQNRIEDVNYVTKRLREYRCFQKSGGLSMH